MRTNQLLPFLFLPLAVAACGDGGGSGDDDPDVDARPAADAADIDAADIDAAVPDAMPIDAMIDAMVPDAMATPSELIGYARAAADGAQNLLIQDVMVTHIRPAVGNDPAGFTIQAEQAGPALFIVVDPATLDPVPAVGDVVDFTITEMSTVGMMRGASMITGWSRDSTGGDASALAQDVSAATDLTSAIGSYESELINVTATIAGPFGFAGTGFDQAPINTAGSPNNDTNLRVRLPTTLIQSLDLATGCAFTLTETPFHRFNAAAQLMAFTADEISVTSCPAPRLSDAVPTSSTSVQLTFDRQIAPASVMADGSQFTFDGGLTASAASVTGNVITVTTSPQAPGVTYTVTVAASVTDTLGTAINDLFDTDTFTGFQPQAVVRINEVNANIANGCDLIELRVISGGSMSGWKLRERTTDKLTFPAFTVATNDIIVVHLNGDSATCNPNTATQETSAIAEQPAATFAGNYDTAYDFWPTGDGSIATNNVFAVVDAAGVIIDAMFADDNNGDDTTASATETAAAEVAAATQWEMDGGGIPTNGFVDADFVAHAVFDLNGTGTDAAGETLQRDDDADANTKLDWVQAASSWGALNAGQSAL